MNQLEYSSCREIIIRKKLIHPEDIEAEILDFPTIVDCRVLAKNCQELGLQLAAYVVSKEAISFDKLHHFLKSRLSDTLLPIAYIGITNMPLTKDGRVDEEVLRQLVVVNENLVRNWETELQKLPMLDQYAVISQDKNYQCDPLHLQNLCPLWEAKLDTEEVEDIDYEEGEVSDIPAISDGGKLKLDKMLPQTLSDAFLQAQKHEHSGIIYVQQDGSDVFISYDEILEQAKKIVTGLEKNGLKANDVVILQLNSLEEFVVVFWACLLAGVIPLTVAIAPTYESKNGVLDKLFNAWDLLKQPLIISSNGLLPRLESFQSLYNLTQLKTLAVSELLEYQPATIWYESQPEDIAFLQLSSGSTGVSKCIPESHRAVIGHIQAATQINQYCSDHITLNWLPMDHVGPLLMYHVRDVYLGIKQIQVPPHLILNDPTLWLDYLQKYLVTHTWCANFGYKRVNDCLLEYPHKSWDLSSVQVFCNAGEQVTLPVVQDFIHLTKKFQVRPEAIQPAYGMAEAATALTFCNGFNPQQHVHHIEKVSLQSSLNKVEQEAADTVAFIVQGPPSPGITIRIVDNQNQMLPERKIGRVQLTGATIMSGYLYNEEANSEAFTEDGWYNTGDLGYLLDGELVITGREKDLIVVYGANYYCADIEAVVNDIVGVRPTFVAATGLNADSGTEQLAIFFVPVRKELKQNIELLEVIKTQVTLLLGINPAFVIPLAEEEFPKTTSGKIQRAKLKSNLLSGLYDKTLQNIDCYQRNENTLPNWFFQTLWRPRQAQLIQSDYPQGPYLLFLDEHGLGRSVVKELRDSQECIVVEAGDDYQQVNRHHYRIIPNNSEHYHLLFTSLISHHITIRQIVHFWNYRACEEITSVNELEETQKWVMCNFLLLIQNIIKHHDFKHILQCHIISSETQVVNDTDKAYYARATLMGLVKTLPQEVPWLQCRHIDIPFSDNQKNTAYILQELKSVELEPELAYRDGQRFIKRLKLVKFERPTKKNIPLKMNGVYLISGGLGHIGLAVCQMLLDKFQARLIIIGRTSLEANRNPEQSDDNQTRQHKAIEFLQQFPGQFQYHSVDICNQARLESLVQNVESKWGRELDGIFHLAGYEQPNLLKDETRDSLARLLRPKVMGSWVLHQILAKRASSKADNKVFIHFSSLSSHFGDEKSGAEAAANSFLNSFSNFQNQHSNINSLCFAWSRWHESVMGKSSRTPLSADSGYHEMSQHQALLSLMVALQHQQKFLLIGLNGAKRRIRYQIDMDATNSQEITAYFVSQPYAEEDNELARRYVDNNELAYDALKELTVSDCFQTESQCHPFHLKTMPVNDKGLIDRKKLIGMQVYDSTNTEVFVQASSKTEQQLSWLWQEILAISQPSVHDNFFKLGGNSLLATVFTSRVRDIFYFDLSIQAIFKSPTIAQIAEILDNKELEQETPIPILPKDSTSLPRLSIGQERLWFLYQLAPDNPQYNIPVTVHIRGDLNIIALIKSFNQLVQRHEPLRTRFTYRNNQAVQYIAKEMELSLSITDIAGTQEQQKQRLQEIIQAETLKPFEITRLPLIRVKLYRLADDHYVLFTVLHHIIADGWSMGLFFHDLTRLYKASQSELSMPLPALDVHYSDYAVWQRDWLSGKRLQTQMDYWTQQLTDLPVLNLIPDRPRSKTTANKGARHTCYIEPQLNTALVELGQQQEASLFMTLLSAFMVLCARYTGQDDIAIGTAIANRNRREIEPLIGFFTNTLVMRGDLSGNPDFLTVLQRIKNIALDAYDHQDLPFGHLVDALQPQREIGQNPLAQVVFVMQNSPAPVTDIPGVEFSPYEVESGLVKMDIEVNVYEVNGGLRIETEFNRDLFDMATIERMFDQYQLILAAVTQDPLQTINTIPLLTLEEQQRLFASEMVSEQILPAKFKCIHEMVEQVANTNPQATAVIFEQQTLSYEQLNQKANQLACYLQQQGVQSESLVGICIERSTEMIIALLAIFKAGGAYVPLDPVYPENRLQFILDDTALKVIVTQQSLLEKLPENPAQKICIDKQWQEIDQQSIDNLDTKISANNLAYIIYTSGSTGNPKGVLIEHKGLSNLAFAQIDVFDIQPTDKVLQFSSLNFDASISEIAMTLVSGAQLLMVKQNALMFGAPLLRLLEKEHISIATIPPSVLTTLPVEGHFLPDLKTIIVAGEAANIDLIKLWSKDRRLINAYGPTETSVCATAYLYKNEDNTPPIGRAIANTWVYLLDKFGQPVPVGIPGEMYIGGIGVARGYLNRSELTVERFVPDPFCQESDARMYRSGDLARYLPDGNIEYLGRIDQQVKIRGFRVEPGEIENRLREHTAIKEAFIHVNKSEPQNPFLEAFVTQSANKKEDVIELISLLKSYLKDQLPPHMVPASINVIEKIPLTHNGKLDYTKLAAVKISQTVEDFSSEVAKSNVEESGSGEYAETESIIIQVIAEKLHLDEVGIHSHFFDELGGNSLGMVHIHKKLEKRLPQTISLIDLFEYPSVAQLTQFLTQGSVVSAQAQLLQEKMPQRVNKQQTEAIAIIGMSGRFPGASSVEEFWEKLKQGEELVQKFTKEELLEAGIDKALLENPKYLRRKGALEGVEDFDAQFFNFTPKEAMITDPQQRLFLETTWEAFEHAGYDPYNYPGTVGIMGGMGSSNTYYQKNLQYSDFGKDVVGDYQLSLNNSADFLCTRVAYKLNLQGSAATIQSACSTSLVPSVMGYQALINYQADLIVAGGSAISLPAKGGYLYEEGMILSPDGHCRTFDDAAQGTVPGNATGVVLLKRLEDAIYDGDTIYATIRGAAFNNDGDRKVGFTASGLHGQMRVISEALETANVSPESISYVEAHGTATPLGDPIEIRALTKAWYGKAEEKKKGYCAIGSVKSNTGHCDAAAGVTGLIKTVCALHHKQIPPSLHYRNANRQIDFTNSPFYVNTQLSDWKSNGTPRRAGVSSFGMGGTNAHVILEEAPAREASSRGRDWLMFMLSAKTPTALEAMQAQLLKHLHNNPVQNPADIAYTSQVGRHAFNYRQVILCENNLEAILTLSTDSQQQGLRGELVWEKTPDIVFLFPGQGSQYLNMAKDLYLNEMIFREHLDRCAEFLEPLLQQDIRDILYPADEDNDKSHSERLNRTDWAQPILFAVEYAMAQLLMAWGIRPAMMAGHSLGEYTAACVSGVMSLEDCLKIVSIRARLMQSMPTGSMLAVPLSEDKLEPYLQELDLAAINGPERCVVSGSDEAIQALQQLLQGEGIDSRLLHTSHAYHSDMMETMLAEFYQALEDIEFHTPSIPLISSVNGKPVKIMDRAYWTSQIRETVRFANVLGKLYETPENILLEVGPGNTLSSFARGHHGKPSETIIYNTLRHPKESRNDNAFLFTLLAKLWIAGVTPDWKGFYQDEKRYRVPIPTYPFERKRYWVDAPVQSDKAKASVELYKKPDIKDWFYTPSWKRTELMAPDKPVFEKTSTWLIFMDDKDIGEQFAKDLLLNEQVVIKINKGKRFFQQGDSFVINPEHKDDYVLLFEALKGSNQSIGTIIHCWGVYDEQKSISDIKAQSYEQHTSLNSLLYMLQTIGLLLAPDSLNLLVLTNQVFNVTGLEEIIPEYAMIQGAMKVIPQEYPYIDCIHADISLSEWVKDKIGELCNYLLVEVENKSSAQAIAYRNNYRWLETYEPIQLKETQQVALLRQQGVYFITGGLGGIGLALADYLSESFQARLVLISRTSLPEKQSWLSWLQNHDKQERISQIIQQLQKIESKGGEFLILTADVTNIEQMQNALQQTIEQFGCVNGVIHAAGVAGLEIIQNLTKQEIERSLAAKVLGVQVLDAVFKSKRLDFILLCSSLATVFGGLGYAVYCAANAFLDAFAQQKSRQKGTKILSIDWEGWSEVGMAVDNKMVVAKSNDLGLLTQEGVEVFRRILNQKLPQVIISTADLNVRLEKNTRKVINKTKSSIEILQKRTTESNFNPPTNATEEKIAAIWEKSLGIKQIGIDDDFFELGGDSLTAVQLIPKLKELFEMELSPHSLIHYPTIRALAKIIEQEQSSQSDEKVLSSLLVELKAGKFDEPPLFLIHPVGGSVYIYRDLANSLNTEQTVYGIQARGWDGKEKPLETINEMATLYTEIIRQVQPQGPYRIGGASLGGVIAFEMAQQLLSAEQKIDLLFMIDTPGTGHMPKDVFKTDLDILLYLLNISSDSVEFVENVKSLKGDEQLQFFINEQNKTGRQLFPNIDELRHFLKLFKVNADALRQYQSKAYNGDILFFVAKEKDEYNAKNPQAAWSQMALQRIEVLEVNGNHITMNQSPNVNAISRRIKQKINKL